eukprot:6286139-Amphidinium_carterae.1
MAGTSHNPFLAKAPFADNRTIFPRSSFCKAADVQGVLTGSGTVAGLSPVPAQAAGKSSKVRSVDVTDVVKAGKSYRTLRPLSSSACTTCNPIKLNYSLPCLARCALLQAE